MGEMRDVISVNFSVCDSKFRRLSRGRSDGKGEYVLELSSKFSEKMNEV